MEVAVVAALSGILFLLLFRWIGSLISASTLSIDVSSTQRDIAFANDQLQSDLEKAQGCDPYGLDVPIRDIKPNSLQLWADADKDGKADVISWRVQDGIMQRAVVKGDGTCSFTTENPLWKTLVEGVPASENQTTFIGYRNGSVVRENPSDPTSPPRYPNPNCTGANAEKCIFDSIEFNFSIRSAGEDKVPFKTTELYPVNLSSSRLVS